MIIDKDFMAQVVEAVREVGKEYPIIVGSFGKSLDRNNPDEEIFCFCPLSALYFHKTGRKPTRGQAKQWDGDWAVRDDLLPVMWEAGFDPYYDKWDVQRLTERIDQLDTDAYLMSEDSDVLARRVSDLDALIAHLESLVGDENDGD